MTLLDSLLDAIIRLDGEALIMHAGEKPYVVLSSASMSTYRGPVAWGQVELSSRPLTTDAVLGMLGQMLSPEQSHALDELGAIEQEIDAPGGSGERFVVTAARGGDDVWVEVRRRARIVEAPPAPAGESLPPVAAEDAAPAAEIPEVVNAAPPLIEPVAEPEPQPVAQTEPEPVEYAEPEPEPVMEMAEEVEADLSAFVDEAANASPIFEIARSASFDNMQTEASRISDEDEHHAGVFEIETDGASAFEIGAEAAPIFEIAQRPAPVPPQSATVPAIETPAEEFGEEPFVIHAEEGASLDLEHEITVDAARSFTPPPPMAQEPAAIEEAIGEEPAAIENAVAEVPAAIEDAVAEEPAIIQAAIAEAPSIPDEPIAQEAAEVPAAVVVPHARPALKLQQPPPPPAAPAASTEASLIDLLRAAAGHGASTVYAVVDTRPMMRVEGRIALVGTQPSVASGDVERFIFEFAPREHVADAAPEWTCTVPGVGRVRCVTFRDHSGAGLIFHLPARDASTADELGIPAELQALCAEADGLVVVSGPRSSGKSTLLSAFVDLINRTRYDHVITIESQIRRVHEKRLSFISQREVRGDGDAIAAAARAALREGPDVLVIEDLRAPEALIAALDAARAGRLVFGSISARTAPVAVERLIDVFPADRRPQVRASLAGSLRAVIAQLLVPKAAGGRIAAREVLLSSPAVRKLVLDGAIEQLPIAIESGRGLGMATMVDSLGALVRDSVVEIAEACACAPDRAALIAALERDGIDVTGVERRA